MDVCLSHMTALHWLLRNFNPRRRGERPSRALAIPTRAPDARLAEEIYSYIGSSLPEAREGYPPLDVLVSRRSGRRSSNAVVSHLCVSDLPEGSFVSLGMRALDIWVTSPELTFLQLAETLGVVGTAYVGMALCSDFRLDAFDASGVVRRSREGDVPLTSVARIGRYLARSSGVRGVALARRALRYVRDGAYSPPEGGIALAAELPPLLGGYSLGEVSLNQGIRAYAGVDDRGAARYVTRYPDVIICSVDGRGRPRAAAIDFDPSVTHGDEIKRQLDLDRGNQITAARRLDHFTFTGRQADDYDAFAASMDQVRRALGVRRTPRDRTGRAALRVDLARRDLWESCLHGGILL